VQVIHAPWEQPDAQVFNVDCLELLHVHKSFPEHHVDPGVQLELGLDVGLGVGVLVGIGLVVGVDEICVQQYFTRLPLPET
jgi:hypothetical protein